MAKAKIEHHWDKDARGKTILVLEKLKGKLTLDEITEYLKYKANLYGVYAIILNVQEFTTDLGWPEEEQEGDVAVLYEIIESDDCPICGKGVKTDEQNTRSINALA